MLIGVLHTYVRLSPKLLSHDGWSGNSATGCRGLPAKEKTTGGDTYQQLTTYVGKINSLNELQYYFDLGKVTDINLIKDRFKVVFVANAEDLFGKNVAMFSNIAINPTSKIDTWQKLKAVAQDDALFDNLIGSKIINLE